MSKKNNFRRILSALLALIVSVPMMPVSFVFAEGEEDAAEDVAVTAVADENSSEETSLFVKQKTYSEYYDEIEGKKRPDKEVPLVYTDCADGAQIEIGTYEGKDNCIIWSNDEGTLNFTVDVPESGAYSMMMSYNNNIGIFCSC